MKLPPPRYDAALVAEVEDYLDQEYATRIIDITPASLVPGVDDGVQTLHTEGGLYSGDIMRPMFQLIGVDQHGFLPATVRLPCAACYDFSRTAACPDHPEVRS